MAILKVDVGCFFGGGVVLLVVKVSADERLTPAAPQPLIYHPSRLPRMKPRNIIMPESADDASSPVARHSTGTS
jgi:hypothetical protein